MAISLTSWGKGADYKSASTIVFDTTISFSNLDVDDWVIFCFADDSFALAYVSYSRGGSTWTTTLPVSVMADANNSGNVRAQIAAHKITTSVYSAIEATGSSDDVYCRVHCSSGSATAAAGYHAKGLYAYQPDKNATATGSSGNPSSGATAALSQADELVIGAIGTEGPNDDSQGSWVTGDGYVSGNEQFAGTNSNGAAANICIATAAEIVSATTAQTAEKTGIQPRDWAACVLTLKAAAGGIQVTPAQAEANAATMSPAVILGSTSTTPALAEADASCQPPGIVLTSISLTPALAEARASTLNPGVIKGPINITPALAEAQAVPLDPAVVLGSISTTPGLAGALASALDPAVLAGGGVEVTPAVAEALASCLDPTVVLGSINVTPAIAEVLASCEDPAVVLGPIGLTPAFLEALASVEDPSAVQGSIALTPALVSALASTIDPVVSVGTLYVTPATAEALAAALTPSVLQGSVTVSPAVLEALALALDPNVVITGEVAARLRALNLFWTFGVGGKR